MRVRPLPVATLTDKLTKGENFALSRFGDGEWNAILGNLVGEKNCDGSPYTIKLRDELRSILKANSPYFHTMTAIARRLQGDEIDHYIAEHKLPLKWWGGDSLLNALLVGGLHQFFMQVNRKRVMYVGPIHLKDLKKDRLLNVKNFVNVPYSYAYDCIDNLVDKIHNGVLIDGIDFIGFSAGMATKAMIERLYAIQGDAVTMVDFGSMFDGFYGVVSRKYIQHADWRMIVNKNFL